MKTLNEHCVALGLVKGTKEYKKEYNAEKYRRRSPEKKREYEARRFKNLSPDKKKKKRELDKKRKAWLRKNDQTFLEKERERDRKRQARKRETEREKVNERQRKQYREGGDERRKKINEGKHRRNPSIGLASLIRDVQAGRRDPRDLINFTRAAIEQCSSLVNRGKGKGISEWRNI